MTGSAYYVRFDELADILGPEDASKLIKIMGGKRSYIRERLKDDHPVVAAIGAEAAAKFAAHMATGIGGLAIELPIGETGSFAQYRRRLRELAADLGCSDNLTI